MSRYSLWALFNDPRVPARMTFVPHETPSVIGAFALNDKKKSVQNISSRRALLISWDDQVDEDLVSHETLYSVNNDGQKRPPAPSFISAFVLDWNDEGVIFHALDTKRLFRPAYEVRE